MQRKPITVNFPVRMSARIPHQMLGQLGLVISLLAAVLLPQ